MALVFEILLGVAILASFYVAYMSAKSWQVYQVVLVAFIFLASVGFFYLAARTMATHNAWRSLANRQQRELDDTVRQISETADGGPVDEKGQPNPLGARQLKEQLYKLAIDRGGVLYDVVVDGVKDGAVQLTMKSPEHGLVPKTVLFAFDQAPFEEGGRYQGEFRVVSVGENSPNVQVAPNLPTEAQLQRLATVKGPWTLYTTMPIDNSELFASLDDAARQAVLPKDSLQEYANPQRKLRDYEYLFHENFVQRSLLNDSISELNSNIARITADTKQTNDEVAYRETEKANLATDLAKFQYEQKAIATYRQSLEQLYGQVRDLLKTRYADNNRMAAELTAAQTKAAQEIDARSGPAGPAAN